MEAETLMEKLGKRIQAIETELADPALYEKNAKKAADLGKERADLTAKLAQTEESWLEMSAEYEEAMAS